MPRIHKPIELTKEEKELLEGMLSKGFYQSRKLRRARILLKNHEHHCPTDIAQLEKCSLPRSEEHTSELQSRENLVCRLLLEKKKVKRATAAAGRRADARS